MTTETIEKTHNQPPVELPTEERMLADLQRKYPEIDKRLQEWDGAFAEYPLEIPLEQEDVAGSLQDLIGQVKKDSKVWTDSYQKQEKKPLNALVKVVGNFFTGRVEKAQKFIDKYAPVHENYLLRVAEKNRKAAEEEAERQRQKEAEARKAAEAAAAEQAAAEQRAAEQRQREQEEREKAAKAQREREEAEAAAAAAKEKERREAQERRERETAEKEQNTIHLREIRDYLKEAEKLHALAEADEASTEEQARLGDLIRPGGIIGELARPVAASLLLDDDQKERIATVRTRLGELRDLGDARLNKRQKAAADKARKEEAERQAKEDAEREEQRKRDQEAAAKAKQEREAAEAAAAKAKEEKAAAEKAARDAKEKAREEEQAGKAAGKEVKGLTTEADRNANRADRIENKLEKSTEADLSRTRGELGTVGGLARRWNRYITDEAALRAVLGPLGEHFTTDALEGATWKWMLVHRPGFTGERVEPAELPGVVFIYETEARIS